MVVGYDMYQPVYAVLDHMGFPYKMFINMMIRTSDHIIFPSTNMS